MEHILIDEPHAKEKQKFTLPELRFLIVIVYSFTKNYKDVAG